MNGPNRTEFNLFVQSVQADAIAWGVATQFDVRGSGKEMRSTFQIWWDGKWHTLAIETPFAPDAERDPTIYDVEWTKLQSRMAKALAES